MGVAVGRGVDDNLEPLAPCRVGAGLAVLRADVDAWIARWGTARDVGKFSWIIGGEEDVVARQRKPGRARIRKPYQGRERAGARLHRADSAAGLAAEMAVGERSRIGVDDDRVGDDPLATGEKDGAGATLFDFDLGDRRPEPEAHPVTFAEPAERVGKRAEATIDQPDPLQIGRAHV